MHTDMHTEMHTDRPVTRLHIGCGASHLRGWVNIDREPFPGVDLVADVTRGLAFEQVETVYAEHFLEHLAIEDALAFLKEVRRVLAPEGWLRLSTPNLDWVWATHYRLDAAPDVHRTAALHLNRAFHGWGHQFLWNRTILEDALRACGFESIRFCRYGESTLPIFQGIEQHETYGDSTDLPHVLIAEAQPGPAPVREDLLTALRDHLRRDFHT
jgi:predicted SAM-dependent methyltransferase